MNTSVSCLFYIVALSVFWWMDGLKDRLSYFWRMYRMDSWWSVYVWRIYLGPTEGWELGMKHYFLKWIPDGCRIFSDYKREYVVFTNFLNKQQFFNQKLDLSIKLVIIFQVFFQKSSKLPDYSQKHVVLTGFFSKEIYLILNQNLCMYSKIACHPGLSPPTLRQCSQWGDAQLLFLSVFPTAGLRE